MFSDRTAYLFTMHQKERAIAPVLQTHLQMNTFVPSDINTDRFGTFSGEIPRLKSAFETVQDKCKNFIEQFNSEIGIASEGSFGPHPTIGFIPCNEELLHFIDQKNDLHVTVKHLSLETNFMSSIIQSEDQLESFAQRALFPSHALMIGTAALGIVKKGITHWDDLRATFDSLMQTHREVVIETDMRACFNPTRMKHIEEVARILCDRLLSRCPKCEWPNYAPTSAEKGLPCSLCGFKTQSTLYLVYSCSKCAHQHRQYFPNGREYEDPQYCDLCNP